MRAGPFLAYGPWSTPGEQVELAVLADELGLDSVWVSEAWGQDAVSVLGLPAGKTEQVALGSGLFQIPARAPAATAMAAATIADGWLPFMLDPAHGVELAGRAGHGDAARECRDAFLAGDRGRAAGALTPGLIDAMALATTPEALPERLAAFEPIGVDTLLAVPCGGDRPAVVRALAGATA